MRATGANCGTFLCEPLATRSPGGHNAPCLEGETTFKGIILHAY